MEEIPLLKMKAAVRFPAIVFAGGDANGRGGGDGGKRGDNPGGGGELDETAQYA